MSSSGSGDGTGRDVDQSSTATDAPTGAIRLVLLVSDSTRAIPADLVAYKAQIIAALVLVHANADRFSVVDVSLTVGSTTTLSVTVDILPSSDATEPTAEALVIMIQTAVADLNHVIHQDPVGSLFVGVTVIGVVSTGSSISASGALATAAPSITTLLAGVLVAGWLGERAAMLA